jgi:Acetyltransferase (GNAT) domain/Acetyltransferase (GNAT) family
MAAVSTAALDIRPMGRSDLALGIDWAAAEGWNPGLHDAGSFFAADPGGFLLGSMAGEPVGMISVVAYGRGFGFLGFYIVCPAWRGQGHGLALWHAGMARLAGRVVGLDGVPAQQDNYRRSGFELAWNNVRWQGTAAGVGEAPAGIETFDTLQLGALLDYDAAMFPGERRLFMRHWLQQPGSIVRVARHNDAPAGLGVIRPCRSGWKIGPLFADAPRIADALYRALVAAVPAGDPVQLDVPAPHDEAVALARRHGLTPVFETARMYAGPAPALPMQRLYGITSFELG